MNTSSSVVPYGAGAESRTIVDGCGTESTPGIVLKSSNPNKMTFPESVQSRTMVDLVSGGTENMPEVVCWNE